jgi:hypothetical protein
MFQYTIFEIERQENPEFTKQTSESLSPYRGTEIPLIALPVAFVIVLNLYLFLFRFTLAVRIIKIAIYVFSIFCFAIIMQILGAFLLTVPLQSINFILSLTVPTVLLIMGRYRNIVDNILGVCLCAIAGSVLASYFTINSILVLLAVISFFDYYFVVRAEKIPKIVDVLDRYEIPLAIRYAMGKEPKTEYQLGFGDLIFATGITVAFFVDKDALAALTTILSTTASLTVFLFFVGKKKRAKPYPAIPAIFFGGMVSALLNLWP